MDKNEKVILDFSVEMVHEPIVSRLIKKFDVVVNIIWAQVTPNEEGKLIVALSGDEERIGKSREYLESIGVRVRRFEDHFYRDEDECYDCGLCVSVCPFGAIEMNRENWKVEFNIDKCMACGNCVATCPPKVIHFDLMEELEERED